jgi:hypothetical protein
MTVYVDKPREVFYRYPGAKWCHMMATDIDELHDMAIRIGLRRSYFQDNPFNPHYDLTLKYRTKAVKAGAIEVTSRNMLELCSLRKLQNE